MFAVTGASGQLGRLVVEALKKTVPADRIVAILRDPAKGEDLGVPLRRGDYADPASLVAALAGVERVLLISGNDFERRVDHHRNVVEAAKTAGVGHLVYTSVLKADRWTIPGFDGHAATEAIIRASGLSSTILRNGWYTENVTATLGGALAAGAIVGAAGTGRISYAERRDYAEAAAAVLSGEGHVGRTYELAGDTAHSLADIAAEVSAVVGRPIPYNDLAEEAYAGVLASVGLPQGFAALLAAVDAKAVAAGMLEDDTRTLSSLIGRPTTPVRETIARSLA